MAVITEPCDCCGCDCPQGGCLALITGSSVFYPCLGFTAAGFGGSVACSSYNGTVKLTNEACHFAGTGYNYTDPTGQWGLSYYSPAPFNFGTGQGLKTDWAGGTFGLPWMWVLTHGPSQARYWYPAALDGTGPWIFRHAPAWLHGGGPPDYITPTCAAVPDTIAISPTVPARPCVPCCESLLPDTLFCNLVQQCQQSGHPVAYCACLGGQDGTTYTLTRSPVDRHWYGSGAYGNCGPNVTIDFWLNAPVSQQQPNPAGCSAMVNVDVEGGGCSFNQWHESQYALENPLGSGNGCSPMVINYGSSYPSLPQYTACCPGCAADFGVFPQPITVHS